MLTIDGKQVAGRAVHLVKKLRMAMVIAPPGGDFVVQFGEAIDHWHHDLRSGTGADLRRRTTPMTLR